MSIIKSYKQATKGIDLRVEHICALFNDTDVENWWWDNKCWDVSDINPYSGIDYVDIELTSSEWDEEYNYRLSLPMQLFESGTDQELIDWCNEKIEQEKKDQNYKELHSIFNSVLNNTDYVKWLIDNMGDKDYTMFSERDAVVKEYLSLSEKE